MRSLREIIALFLAMASLFSIPLGIVILWTSCIGGGLADTGREENIAIGIALFGLCLFPPLALASWIRI